MKFETKYAPNNLNEVVYPTARIEKLVKLMVPSMGRNLIFYGPPGTGKTTCAKLIPVEATRTIVGDQSITDAEILFYTGDQLNAAGMDKLKMAVSLVPLNVFDKHVVVIDEADRMTSKAMGDLKIVMDKAGEEAVWLICTNDITKVSGPVLSRCSQLDFTHCETDQLVKRAKAILAHEGVVIAEEHIVGIAQSANGDLRTLNRALHEVVDLKAA